MRQQIQERGGTRHLAAQCGVVCMRMMTNTGNLRVQLRPPCAGPADPRPLFTYNSNLASTVSEFGNGWSNSFKRSVSEVSSSAANVNTGTGVSYSYTGRSLRLRPPPLRDQMGWSPHAIWADHYYRNQGKWPAEQAGPIPGTSGETWRRQFLQPFTEKY